MDKEWYMELVADMAAFTPDQGWNDILSQLVDTMTMCTGKLTSAEMGRLITIAAAIQRKGEGEKGWWAR